jgi:hypothetical protein
MHVGVRPGRGQGCRMERRRDNRVDIRLDDGQIATGDEPNDARGNGVAPGQSDRQRAEDGDVFRGQHVDRRGGDAHDRSGAHTVAARPACQHDDGPVLAAIEIERFRLGRCDRSGDEGSGQSQSGSSGAEGHVRRGPIQGERTAWIPSVSCFRTARRNS